MSPSYDQTNTVQHIGPDNTVQTPTEFERDLRSRSHLRDEKHAALSVLMDRELLVTYALAAREVRTNFNHRLQFDIYHKCPFYLISSLSQPGEPTLKPKLTRKTRQSPKPAAAS